jgi:signal transduction histidine kinase
VIIDDVRGDEPLARDFRLHAPALMATQHSYVRSWMVVPMISKAEWKGMLLLASSEPAFYTEHHARMALAIAQQAAIAIENARLFEQAQDAAVVAERQRLSRELHDSVSQALYGIGLGAETTRALLERDPAQASRSNDYVRALAAIAMAEMRALIFELRPESLEGEGLVAGLRKQAAAMAARFGVPVETTLCQEPPASLAAKEALYRIALEALHNAFKHAQPRRVELRLALSAPEQALLLEVRDDGQGFATGGSFPGHLGLRSMAERAARLGGTGTVESTPGRGTCVRARIPGDGATSPAQAR